MGGPDHLRLVRYRAAAKRCAVLSDGRPGRCAAWNEDLLLQVFVRADGTEFLYKLKSKNMILPSKL